MPTNFIRQAWIRLALRLAEILGPNDGEVDWRKYAKKITWLRRAGIKIGDQVIIRSGFRVLESQCHRISIGDRVILGPRVHLWSFNAVTIEQGACLEGVNIVVNGGHDPDTLEPLSGPTVIGAGSYLEVGVKVVRPAQVGEGARIRTGSTVVGDLPKDSDCLGTPAKSQTEVKPSTSEWRFRPEGWPKGDSAPSTWDTPSSVRPYLNGWDNYLQLLQKPEPFGYLSPVAVQSNGKHAPTLYGQNVILTFAYCICLASRMKSNLRILDYGGALGYYKLVAQRYVPEVSLDYTCFDVPSFCSTGVELLPSIKFESREEAAFGGQKFDMILSFGALQNIRDWQSKIELFANSLSGYLLLGRLPVSADKSFVVEQSPGSHGFDRSYPQWIFSRVELLATCEKHGFRLVQEFLGGEKSEIPGAPQASEFMAYLFFKGN